MLQDHNYDKAIFEYVNIREISVFFQYLFMVLDYMIYVSKDATKPVNWTAL